jgi:hypothetical protein
MQQKFGPELWAECRARLSGEMLKRLDGFMADPKYQLEARIKIWKEIGVDLSKVINAA